MRGRVDKRSIYRAEAASKEALREALMRWLAAQTPKGLLRELKKIACFYPEVQDTCPSAICADGCERIKTPRPILTQSHSTGAPLPEFPANACSVDPFFFLETTHASNQRKSQEPCRRECGDLEDRYLCVTLSRDAV